MEFSITRPCTKIITIEKNILIINFQNTQSKFTQIINFIIKLIIHSKHTLNFLSHRMHLNHIPLNLRNKPNNSCNKRRN